MKRMTERMVSFFIIIAVMGLFTLAPLMSRDADRTVSAAISTAAKNADLNKSKAQQGDSIARALKDCSEKKKFVVALFYEKDDDLTKSMKSVFNEAKKNYGKDTAVFVALNVNNKKEQASLAKYEISGAKKPVLLVLSKEGMVLNGFVQKVTLADIKESFVPDKVLTLLKAAQERKLIFVCFRGKNAAQFEKALKEVDSYSRTVRNSIVIRVNPEDKDDSSFFSMFKIAPEKGETHVAIINQGRLGGIINGAVDKSKIDALLKSCSSGCGSG